MTQTAERTRNNNPLGHNIAPKGDPDFSAFLSQAKSIIPEARLKTDELSRFAHGTDASIYRMTPKLVVLVETEDEISALCRIARKTNVSITFRAAGTSLSGQAVTNEVLVKLGNRGWRQSELLENGKKISLGPALTGAQANSKLKFLNKKIGPDPASINAAMIGGIAANNSSGMCCGTKENTYQTITAMQMILADGTKLDTASPKSRLAFEQNHPETLNALKEIAARTNDNADLVAKIKKKYRIKNTMGYCLNALIDFEDPFDMLMHLMVGSEGTLGFISEITLETVDDHPHKSSAIVLFKNIHRACKAVTALNDTPVSAVELMDDAALKSINSTPELKDLLADLPDGVAGILIDVREASPEHLQQQISEVETCLAAMGPINEVSFSSDLATYNLYWSIRKGLFPKVSAVREQGTTVIIEDVAVEIEKLADAVIDLQALFKKHNYHEAVIFGHALAGNLHFVITQAFDTKEKIERYKNFMDDLAKLISGRYEGSLKAEHATGRNMAPFLELEWGKDAYELMWEIKNCLDPENILNPGVILTKDPNAHIRNLKHVAPVHSLIDQCIECGFCEQTCPSRDLTLTPRQRISALREIERRESKRPDKNKQDQKLSAFKDLYSYQGVDTCAGDGLCQLACPVGIDTGQMIREVRSKRRSSLARKTAGLIARNFALTCNAARLMILGLFVMRRVIGIRALRLIGSAAHTLSFGLIPPIIHDLPRPLPPFVTNTPKSERKNIVYFSSCASRVLAREKSGDKTRSLAEVTENLFNRAGYNLIQPEFHENLCCGQPFTSKGCFEAGNDKASELVEALKTASRDGRDPIAFDTSPCSLRIKKNLPEDLQIHDITEAIDTFLLDKLDLEKRQDPIALHVTCSTRRMGLEQPLVNIAKQCANEVILPEGIECCGFAGDKGFTQPELNASALAKLDEQLPANCQAGYSTSVTCELGLKTHSSADYQSIMFLLEQQATSDRSQT